MTLSSKIIHIFLVPTQSYSCTGQEDDRVIVVTDVEETVMRWSDCPYPTVSVTEYAGHK